MDAAQIQATMQSYLQTLGNTFSTAPTSTNNTPPTSSAPFNLIDQFAMSQYLCNANTTLNPALLAMLLNSPPISTSSMPMYSNPFDTRSMSVANPLLAINSITNQSAQLNSAQFLVAMASTAPLLPPKSISNAGAVVSPASSSTSSLARPSASPGSDSENLNGCRKRRHHNDNSVSTYPRSQTHSPTSNVTDFMRSRAFTCPDGIKSRAVAQKVKQDFPKRYSVTDISNPVNRHHPDNMVLPSEENIMLEQMAAIYLMNAMNSEPKIQSPCQKISDKRFRPVWDESRENTPERGEPEIDVVAVDPPNTDLKSNSDVKSTDVIVLVEKNFNATQA